MAPQKAGIYKFLITQKDSLGQIKTSDSPVSMTVIEKTAIVPVATPTYKNIKTTTTGSRIVFDFGVDTPPASLAGFKIAYGKNADSLSEEVSTHTIDRIASTTKSGAYTWYIDTIPVGTYTFKIFGRTKDGSLISGLTSEPIVATIGKDSCTIGNV